MRYGRWPVDMLAHPVRPSMGQGLNHSAQFLRGRKLAFKLQNPGNSAHQAAPYMPLAGLKTHSARGVNCDPSSFYGRVQKAFCWRLIICFLLTHETNYITLFANDIRRPHITQKGLNFIP
jgi:hypothetical protein